MPYLLLTTDRTKTVIMASPIHGHFQAFVTRHACASVCVSKVAGT